MHPTSQALFDSQGKPVTLGSELGRGGEGTVYDVHERADLVAKLYHQPPTLTKGAKLAAMVRLQTPRLVNLAAWPTDTLHSAGMRTVVGFLMPKAGGYKPIHDLYSPKSRMAAFPKADWRFLVHVAANTARAFAVVHEHGHVIGDVNHGNLRVNNEGIVKLIDCDSFQIIQGSTRFLCEVGVSTHTPPELQGIPLNSVLRTPNHDAFGLAVLLFQLLFMGRHPFAGRYPVAGDLPLEEAIKRCWFTFSRNGLAQRLQPPPATLPLQAVSGPVAQLFERAFSRDGIRPGARPVAQEWVQALTGLSQGLAQCTVNRSHFFSKDVSACPWCPIERAAGMVLFPIVVGVATSASGHDTLEIIWAKVLAVESPGPAPALPSKAAFSASPSPALVAQADEWSKQAAERKKQNGRALWIFIGTIVLTLFALRFLGGGACWVFLVGCILVVWFVIQAPGGVQNVTRRALIEAETKWKEIEARWHKEAGDEAFRSKRSELERKRRQVLDLPKLRQQKMEQLQAQLRVKQRRRFLDRHEISRANIPGIGPTRVALLESYGIETAADITESAVMSVPGFGPGLTERLVQWRRSVEGRFVFNPSQGIDPADIAAVDRELMNLRLPLERELQNGVVQLQQIRDQTLARRQQLRTLAEIALQELVQAEADVKYVEALVKNS